MLALGSTGWAQGSLLPYPRQTGETGMGTEVQQAPCTGGAPPGVVLLLCHFGVPGGCGGCIKPSVRCWCAGAWHGVLGAAADSMAQS